MLWSSLAPKGVILPSVFYSKKNLIAKMKIISVAKIFKMPAVIDLLKHAYKFSAVKLFHK